MARTKAFDREAVLDRAMCLFWRQGYEATSIQELIVAMGIGRQSLYDTFGDNHALFLAALDRYEERFGAATIAALEEVGPMKETMRRVFVGVIDGALADGGRGCLMTNSAVELAPHDGETAAKVAAGVTRLEAAFYDALVRGLVEGEIAERHDPRALARFLATGVQGLQVRAKATPDRAILRDVVEVTLSVLD